MTIRRTLAAVLSAAALTARHGSGRARIGA